MVRRLLICTLLAMICTGISAQSIEKRYRSFLTSNGMLHFIGKKVLTKTTNISKFEYDITYIAGNDSATVNFSFVSDSPTSVHKCSLINNEDNINVSNPQMMFRDIIKKGYKIRTTTQVAFSDLQKLYGRTDPFKFSLVLENGNSCSASFDSKQWKKERTDIQRVFNSITTK